VHCGALLGGVFSLVLCGALLSGAPSIVLSGVQGKGAAQSGSLKLLLGTNPKATVEEAGVYGG
jgi:hypothetical protein